MACAAHGCPADQGADLADAGGAGPGRALDGGVRARPAQCRQPLAIPGDPVDRGMGLRVAAGHALVVAWCVRRPAGYLRAGAVAGTGRRAARGTVHQRDRARRHRGDADGAAGVLPALATLVAGDRRHGRRVWNHHPHRQPRRVCSAAGVAGGAGPQPALAHRRGAPVGACRHAGHRCDPAAVGTRTAPPGAPDRTAQ
ncbi:hypothetical protein D3C72_1532440 [compost metagenome]